MFTSVDYDKFRALRITQVALQFEELLKDDGNDTRTPEDLFLTAVDEALEVRRSNRIDKLIREAGFPLPHASIAEIDYLPGRGVTAVRMKRYAAHDWRADPTNLLLISPTGGGKTYIACAIGIAACHAEHTVRYTRMDEMARELVIARGDRIAHQNLLNKLSDVDLLIIDDFLTIGIDETAANDLFTVLVNRDHRLPTVIASQSGPTYWVETLPEKVAADSIVNRLASRARTITLGDVDMRRMGAQEAQAASDFWE
ncbi:ATP-binding protein [Arthrobacter sp. CG_A4]|uniref:ATP-binding protein n=1 Tax=Arthrobacter sp. CG_A4 TaxID=3071706 RepID=UPI002DFCE669|nr:DNA replication protein DnaC [Arthrobacter sp. CG_A4]